MNASLQCQTVTRPTCTLLIRLWLRSAVSSSGWNWKEAEPICWILGSRHVTRVQYTCSTRAVHVQYTLPVVGEAEVLQLRVQSHRHDLRREER